MELYLEQGFERTTVVEIAERAGLTARTFFRYFTDKREVLFAGSETLEQAMVAALEAAPDTATPLEAIGAALDAAGGMLGDRREFAGRRQAVIAANAELRERELIKMASLAAGLADGLRRRGVPDPKASLAAEVGVGVFRVAFDRWLAGSARRSLAQVARDLLGELRDLADE